jgi:long-subunit fatty acid transport protein
MKIKKTWIMGTLLVVALLVSGPAPAVIYQKAVSTANPVGSGARGIGWGGAFIAIADDATAASWNPGGLVILVKPEASIALSYEYRTEKFNFTGFDTESENRNNSAVNINYASVVYPFHVGDRNMAVSLNYQRLYDFSRDMKYRVQGVTYQPQAFQFDRSYRFEQVGALTTITPAYCLQITPAWSLGLAVNFWGQDSSANGWEQQEQTDSLAWNLTQPGNTTQTWGEQRSKYEVKGTNYVIGTHYKIQNWTLAAVYKTGWTADVDFSTEQNVASFSAFNPLLTQQQPVFQYSLDEKLEWPESYGVGVAYRYSDRLSFALDTYTIRWSHYVLKFDDINGEEVHLNLLTNNADVNIRDTWQVRMGAEYLWILPKYVVALRGGVIYDPEPLSEHVNEFYGVAVGGGLVYRNFAADAALQYRWANNMMGEKVNDVMSKSDVQEYYGIVSLIYHFK